MKVTVTKLTADRGFVVLDHGDRWYQGEIVWDVDHVWTQVPLPWHAYRAVNYLFPRLLPDQTVETEIFAEAGA